MERSPAQRVGSGMPWPTILLLSLLALIVIGFIAAALFDGRGRG